MIPFAVTRSEEHTSELQSRQYLVCRLLLEKKKTQDMPDLRQRVPGAQQVTGQGVPQPGETCPCAWRGEVLPGRQRGQRPGWFFFFNDTATTEIYTLSLHDALPIYERSCAARRSCFGLVAGSAPRDSSS